MENKELRLKELELELKIAEKELELALIRQKHREELKKDIIYLEKLSDLL